MTETQPNDETASATNPTTPVAPLATADPAPAINFQDAAPANTKRKSGLGTAALVLGIIGIVFAVIPGTSGLGIFLAIVALILGIIGIAHRGGRAAAGTVLGGVALFLGVIFAVVYGIASIAAVDTTSDVSKPAPAVNSSSVPKAAKPAKPAKPTGTVSELQALDSAQDYLSEGSGFSQAGLIGQLSSKYGEGFPKADAIWAVEHSGADWNAQALDSAQGYLSEGSGFSKAGLISQLSAHSGEQFTKAQAEYAVDQSGADWNAQAVDSAKGYLELGGFSRHSLIAQLTSSYGEKFTLAQAEYAVKKVGL